MKKTKIDIPLELYTDNVRRIIDRALHDSDAEPPYLTSFLCDPELTENDLQTALELLEKKGVEKTKQKLIKAELAIRQKEYHPWPFPEDLRNEWYAMQRSLGKRNGCVQIGHEGKEDN